MQLNESFIDFDLTDVPDGIGLNGSTGLLEPPPGVMADSRFRTNIEDTKLLIPRSQWKDRAGAVASRLRSAPRKTKDQGREGACVANAYTQAIEIATVNQFGYEGWVELSAMSLYERIGRSSSSGAYLIDGATEAQRRGALPCDTPANDRFAMRYPPRGFNPHRLNRLEWEGPAAEFRAYEVLKINSVDGWFSALVRGWPIGYGRSRHAICSLLPIFHKGAWLFGYVNSWGDDWGDFLNDACGNGLGFDSERTIDRCEGWAIRGVVRRSGLVVPTPAENLAV